MSDGAAAAAEALRELLHDRLDGRSLQELDGLLVDLAETAFRLSELTGRVERALGSAAHVGGLRLDRSGARRFSSPSEAVVAARADLRHGAAAAKEAGRWLHDARQATATVGLAFDHCDDGVEVEY